MEGNALVLLELGAVVLALAVLARLGARVGLPAIPFYLLAGLMVGEGGLWPLDTTHAFVEIGAELGLILLLFMLGLEYSARELLAGVRSAPLPGAVDLLNAVPGVVAGILLGWGIVPALLLGAVTYVSSSGIIAKLLRDLGRERSPEAPVIVTLLLTEDLAMAVFIPVASALVVGGLTTSALLGAVAAIAAVSAVLLAAVRLEGPLSKMLRGRSDEALLLSILGFVILVAGVAASMHVSAGVGALLAGILLSGPVAANARTLLTPLHDLFAAIFFFFIGLGVRPDALVPLIGAALALAVVGAAGKYVLGRWIGRRVGLARTDAIRAGVLLMPRGEFSVAVAALGATIEPRLVPLAMAYVLILSVATPILYRVHPGNAGRPEDTSGRRTDAPSSTS